MALVGYTIIRNMFRYDYPLEESVFSVLPAVDRHIICECYSDDGTYAEVLRWKRDNPKIHLLRHRWGKHYTILQQVGNYILSNIAQGDWCFQLQADEVMHEDSWQMLQELPRRCQDQSAVGARFHYTHFMANYQTEFDFMYRRKRIFVQQGHGWVWDGDACNLMNGSGKFVDAPVEVFHYGKVHEAKVALLKEQDFQAMYADAGLGFPDPSLKLFEEKLAGVDYYYLFRHAMKEGQVREFTGAHPKIMSKRIEQAKHEGWEQFEAKLSLDREPNDYMNII